MGAAIQRTVRGQGEPGILSLTNLAALDYARNDLWAIQKTRVGRGGGSFPIPLCQFVCCLSPSPDHAIPLLSSQALSLTFLPPFFALNSSSKTHSDSLMEKGFSSQGKTGGVGGWKGGWEGESRPLFSCHSVTRMGLEKCPSGSPPDFRRSLTLALHRSSQSSSYNPGGLSSGQSRLRWDWDLHRKHFRRGGGETWGRGRVLALEGKGEGGWRGREAAAWRSRASSDGGERNPLPALWPDLFHANAPKSQSEWGGQGEMDCGAFLRGFL